MHLPAQTLLQGGRYKIIEKIGQGGFGIAYRAYHKGLQREVCIKEFFFSDFCDRSAYSPNVTIVSTSAEKIQLVDTFRKKFIKEGQRLATFQHVNIVQVMDNFEENSTAYIVMEYIEGGSLEEMITRSGALTEQKTKELILPILDAMEILHNKGLLHLDIKPANIMLRKNQSPVLIDFGISKYIETGYGYTTTAPVGISKGYAPLEQYGGNISDFTKSTDIYSLCATMYKMLTGITPPEPLQILGGGLKSPLTLCPQLSTDLDSLILKGLSVKATDRQQSVAELTKSIRVIIIEEEPEEFDLDWEDPELINKRQLSVLNQMCELEAELEKKQEAKINPKLEEESDECYNIVWEKGHCGFKNSKGKMITEFKYDNARKFFRGLAVVKLKSKFGYVNKQGNEIIPCKYDDACDMKVSLLKVKLDGKYGFMKGNGKEVTSCKYDEVDEDVEGLSWCRHEKLHLSFADKLVKVKLDNKWGVIDQNGNDVITCKYDELSPLTTGTLLIVLLNKKWGVISRKGNEVVPCIYDIFDSHCNYDIFDFSTDHLVKVLLNKKMGIINWNGKEVVSCKYDFIDSFSEGLAKVKLDGKWGYVNTNGNEVISCIYDDADKFSSRGIAHVMLSGKWEDINKNGEKIKFIVAVPNLKK